MSLDTIKATISIREAISHRRGGTIIKAGFRHKMDGSSGSGLTWTSREGRRDTYLTRERDSEKQDMYRDAIRKE